MRTVARKDVELRRMGLRARLAVGLGCALLLVGVQGVGSAAAGTLATFELLGRVPAPKEGAVENTEVALSTVAADGGVPHHLLVARLEADGLLPDFLGGASFSPDGTEIAFAAEAEPEKKGSGWLYLIDTDGTHLHRLPETRGGMDPHFSPDGSALAFSRSKFRSPRINIKKLPPIRGKGYSSTTAWVLDLASGKARRLTPWRNGLSLKVDSFSPDGTTIALTRVDAHRRGVDIILRPLAGGPDRVLTELGEEPDYSPDGRRIVFVGYYHPVRVETEENHGYEVGDLYSIGVDGKGLRRLTENKAIETSPAWDPSGNRIAYIEANPDHSFAPDLADIFPVGNRIRQMNADGTCARTVRSATKVALFGVTWQPGATTDAPLGC